MKYYHYLPEFSPTQVFVSAQCFRSCAGIVTALTAHRVHVIGYRKFQSLQQMRAFMQILTPDAWRNQPGVWGDNTEDTL